MRQPPTPAPPLDAATVEAFKRDGFVAGPQVLTDAEVQELRGELERVLRREPGAPAPVLLHDMGSEEGSPVWQVVDIWRASEAFARVVRHPVLTAAVAQLTGASVLRLWHDQVQYKPADRGGVNMWHQDAPLWPVLRPMTEVSAWVALDDVDVDNGCMWMVPGSHLWGDRMAFLEQRRDFEDLPATFEGHAIVPRSCPVRAGQVHFHHALAWHGSGPNHSHRPRRAVALHFMGGDTRFVESGEHVMKEHIEVADGEPVAGEYFPVVWESGSAG